MNKLVSLGLLALSLSFTLPSALAGNVDVCESLKDKSDANFAPSLYGLCIAWHNADEDAKWGLRNKIVDRAGGDVPDWLGEGGEGGGGEDPVFDCPCWRGNLLTSNHLGNLTYLFDLLVATGAPGTELDDVYTGPLLSINSAGQMESFAVMSDLRECNFNIENVGVPPGSSGGTLPLSVEEGLVCGFEIGVIKELMLK